ncbi:MAG: hypothetical protein E3J78_03685 [Candidatus Cloacimonadota bacterium]|nr:MAG: hypothetical protein E3J78_03685 [Candidatus Cloacimonadota bacterium]
MQKQRIVTAEQIEKSALYSDQEKMSLCSIFGRKEQFNEDLNKLEYRWNLIGFPNNIIKLLRNYANSGKIYVLVDDRLRGSLVTYVSNTIHILENETNKAVLAEGIKKTRKNLENTLIPYYTEFSKNYTAGSMLFHILIKNMISRVIQTQTTDKAEKFITYANNEITKTLNNALTLVLKKSHLPLPEKTTQFIETMLKKIPVYSHPISKTGEKELEEILLPRGLSLTLFNQVYQLFSNELKQTIEKNLLQTLLSQEIQTKQELMDSIEIPLSKVAADEIITTVKQSVSKKLASLEEKKLETQKEIEKNFDGFDETSNLLWEAIHSEVNTIREGARIANIDEVSERSEILNTFINKKMWSIREIIRKKTKLDNVIQEYRKLETLTRDQLIKHSEQLRKVPRIENLSNLYFAFIKHHGENVNEFPSKIVAEAENILKISEKNENRKIFNAFCEKHFLGKKYYPDRLLRRFIKCFEDAIIPLYIQDTLMKFFSIWPPTIIKDGQKELPHLEKEILYVGDYLLPENKYMKMGALPVDEDRELGSKDTGIVFILVKNFSRLVSVLVYDIRGSTFMGMKLGNAQIESSIRMKFGKRMLKIAEKYGAFPIKDTGDGGILLFAENSRELFGKIFSMGQMAHELIHRKLSKDDLMLRESEKSSKMAILTAKEMMLEAQTFVSENIAEYSNWFKEEKERRLFFKGISYAQLPPIYRKIFQIGIGITSGHVNKDIHFSINAYGNPDVTGNLVRDANLYSKARHPDSSVILLDSPSLLNLLLNEEFIEPVVEESRIGDFSETEIYRYLLDKTLKLARARDRKVAYKLKNYGLAIERIGYRVLETGKDERIIPSINIPGLGVEIMDEGEFKHKKGGIVKFIYEVSIEG